MPKVEAARGAPDGRGQESRVEGEERAEASASGCGDPRQHGPASLDLERELRQRSFELEELRATLSQLGRLVSDNLLEPIRSVASFSRLAYEGAGDTVEASTLHHLKHAARGAERVQETLEKLLERVTVEAAPGTWGPVDLRTVVDEARRRLTATAAVNGARVEIEGAFPVVTGNHEELRHVLVSLIHNALRYRRAGAHDHLVRVWAQPRGDGVEVAVSDTGVGVPEALRDEVFALFKRFDHRSSGSGVGLAISRRLVERHGGELRLDPESREGATFYVYLPEVRRWPG